MTKYQYTSVCPQATAAANDVDFDDVLNEYGQAGWDLVAYDFDSGVGIFKRPDKSPFPSFEVYAKAMGKLEAAHGCGFTRDDLLADADAEEAIR
jgi:hypothetical protein